MHAVPVSCEHALASIRTVQLAIMQPLHLEIVLFLLSGECLFLSLAETTTPL
jgi:hypothetical protein